MRNLNKLNEAMELSIGELFTFGEYDFAPIIWRKIDEKLAISENIIGTSAFDIFNNTKYSNSTVRRICNELCEEMGLKTDSIRLLNCKEIKKYFPDETSRKLCKSPEEMDPQYMWWTSDESWVGYICIVDLFGKFNHSEATNSRIGIRPALIIGE